MPLNLKLFSLVLAALAPSTARREGNRRLAQSRPSRLTAEPGGPSAVAPCVALACVNLHLALTRCGGRPPTGVQLIFIDNAMGVEGASVLGEMLGHKNVRDRRLALHVIANGLDGAGLEHIARGAQISTGLHRRVICEGNLLLALHALAAWREKHS